MKMRKLVALVMAVMMLCCIIPFSVAAEGNSATIDFTDKANRTHYSTSQQVWEQNGIVVTNDKGASTSNVGDYGGEGYPARFYKSSTLKIEYPGMTQIVFNCDDYKASYATDLVTSISGADVSADGTVVTVSLYAPADSFVIDQLAAQVRVDSITVYGEGGAVVPPVDPEPDVPVEPDEPVIPDEPIVPGDTAVLDFTTLDNRVSCSTSQQVWKQNGITFTNDKGGSTSNVNEKYFNPVRCYKSSTVTVEYPGMTKIVIDSVTYNDNDYAIGWTDSFSAAATATVVDGDVTIVLDEPANVFVWEKLTAQSRAYTITVYTGDAGDEPVTPPIEPDEPDTPVIPDGTELTIVDAIAMGQTYAHNTFSDAKYYVTGVITEVYNTQYGNMKLADENGNILTIYGSWSEDGSIRYDGMADAPVAGDTVVLYGIIGQYNGTSQMKNAWIMGVIEGDTPDVPDVPDIPTGEWGVIANPVEGVAYKLGLEQIQKGAIYYFTGAMSGFYGATDTSTDNAVDMYVEIVDGGYMLYFINAGGAKQYIKLEQSGTHYNFTFGAEGSVFTLDTDKNAFCAPCGDQICYMGTYGSYVTVGCLTSEKMSDSDYIARLYGQGAAGGDTPVDPDPDVPVDPPVSDEIETDYPFLFGMTQYNVSEEDVYFLAGGMDGYYMATTTDPDAAIVVYVEATNGGYYFYTYDGATKLYINMVVSGTHVNGAYEAKPSTVYRYDAEYGTLIANVDGSDYWFGTRNDKQYTTVGPCKVEYEGFYCEFYYFEEEGDCAHEYESEIIEPSCTISGAIIYTCTLCGDWYDEPIPYTGHTYDDEYDADCNVCGDVRDVPERPVETDADFVVATVKGAAGSTVQVTVSAINNPGIVSTKVKVFFDTTVLKFVGFAEGNFALNGYSTSDPEVANENGYFIINWCDATHPNSTADLLGTLSFEILADTAEGTYPLTIEFSCVDDVFNSNDETVWFNAVDGAVVVVNTILGDADGNGKLNNRDLGMLQQYLNDYDMSGKTFNDAACDLDGNGKINNRDLGALQKLLNQ